MANPAQYVAVPQDWLMHGICTWMVDVTNHAHVHEAMLTRGGWEVWAQLELFFAFRSAVGNAVDREVNHVWPNSPNDRVDFWFWWNLPDPNQQQNPRWGVELKCRTHAEQHAAFNGRVLGDFDKCNQQPDVATHGNTALYAVAISPDANDINGFDQFKWPNTFYTTVQPPVQPAPAPIYVIWRIFQH